MIDEKVKIKCTKCSQIFRKRAQKIRNGFQTNCQNCNRLITFDTSSEDKNIRRALMSAKEVRMALEARPKNESVAQGSVGDSQSVLARLTECITRSHCASSFFQARRRIKGKRPMLVVGQTRKWRAVRGESALPR
jgi:predicted  nucleic acid-binding Zn-ribbon protein